MWLHTTTFVWMTYITIFFITSPAFTLFQAKPALIFDPPLESAGRRQAILVYFPGNGIPASAYQPLVTEIQRHVVSHMALTGAILSYSSFIGLDLPAFLGGASLVNAAIEAANVRGPFDLILAGHSLGGILVQEVLATQRIPYPTHVILHGSYPRRRTPVNIRNNVGHTLTLLGARDGVNRLTIVPAMYNNITDLRTNNVQVLANINHRSFSHGASNAYVDGVDLSVTSSREEGTRVIAQATASFLTVLDHTPSQSSLDYLVPFAQALVRDKNGQTCISAQEQLVLKYSNSHHYNITSENYFRQQLPAFLLATPRWNSSNHDDPLNSHEDIQIKSFYNEPVFNSILRISSFPQAIDILRCKLVKKIDIMTECSCQAMNEMIFEQALAAVPASVQERYRASDQLTFGPDLVEPLAMKWALGKVQWKDHVITAPAHRPTKSDKVYCTLISASQAMEYIMIDSQQKP